MADAEKVGPVRPPPRQPKLWPRLFSPDWIIAAFTVVLAVATLALVGTAILQHFDTIDAVEATKRLALANEKATNDRRRTASAEFVMRYDGILNEPRFGKVTDDIQSHNSDYHLPKYPNKSDADVEEYIDLLGYQPAA